MDPNLFHLDWERTIEVLTGIVIFAFFIERSLSVLFENRLLLPLFVAPGMKELVTLAVAFGICRYTHFDAVRMIVLGEVTRWPGELVTAGVLAGGSKASVKLFRDILGFRSTAYQEYLNLRGQGERPQAAAKAVAKGVAPPPPAGPVQA